MSHSQGNLTERDVTAAASERRRSGRVNYSNPHLIALLRGESSPVSPNVVELPISEADSLSAARGIGVSAVVVLLVRLRVIHAQRWVEGSLSLDACISGGEVPVGRGVLAVAGYLPCGDLLG